MWLVVWLKMNQIIFESVEAWKGKDKEKNIRHGRVRPSFGGREFGDHLGRSPLQARDGTGAELCHLEAAVPRSQPTSPS